MWPNPGAPRSGARRSRGSRRHWSSRGKDARPGPHPPPAETGPWTVRGEPAAPRVGPFLVARVGGDGAPAGSCPGANVVSGFVEARLTESERARVLEHLGGCPECRRVVADLAEAGLHPRESPDSAPPADASPVTTVRHAGRTRVLWAVAGASALAAAAALLVLLRAEPRESPVDGVEAAAAELARAEPTLFAGFAPYSLEQL